LCDLKPANILVGEDETVKVIDVGNARLDSDDDPLRKKVDGTADYLDFAALNQGFMDKASDVWSLGLVLYDVWIGYSPIGEGENDIQILEQVKNFAKIEARHSEPKDKSSELHFWWTCFSKGRGEAKADKSEAGNGGWVQSSFKLLANLAGSTPVPEPVVEKATIRDILGHPWYLAKTKGV